MRRSQQKERRSSGYANNFLRKGRYEYLTVYFIVPGVVLFVMGSLFISGYSEEKES